MENPFGEPMDMDQFKQFLKETLMGESNAEMEAIYPLDPEDQAEWDSIHKILRVAHTMAQEARARKDLLWIKIKRKLSEEDAERDCLRIDNGILFGTKNEDKNKG